MVEKAGHGPTVIIMPVKPVNRIVTRILCFISINRACTLPIGAASIALSGFISIID